MQQQSQTFFDKKILSLPYHPLTPEGEKYVSSMTTQQKKLHELAIVSLASSYFVEKTHGFRAYLKGLDTKSK
jgi:hypothetical protein